MIRDVVTGAPLGARSFLFVPADRPERYDKAAASGADAVIIDLEDAVAPKDKAQARSACSEYLSNGGMALLRINALETAWANADLNTCLLPGVQGVVLPKSARSDQIRTLRTFLGGTKPIFPLVESAEGMLNVVELACAPGVARLLFGTIDFCLDLGIEPDTADLACYRSRVVLASRVAGLLPPVDGVTRSLTDKLAVGRDAARARRDGFGGKLCLHPCQIEPVHAAFRPTSDEIGSALRVLATATLHSGAFELDGSMVDAPVIDRARQVIAWLDRGVAQPGPPAL